MSKWRRWVAHNPRLHKVVHGAHIVCHLVYLAAVSIEGHGIYGKAAMALLGVVVLGLISGEEMK